MEELWQKAVRWLNQVGVLPPDCPALTPNAKVYDLAIALQVFWFLSYLSHSNLGWHHSLQRFE